MLLQHTPSHSHRRGDTHTRALPNHYCSTLHTHTHTRRQAASCDTTSCKKKNQPASTSSRRMQREGQTYRYRGCRRVECAACGGRVVAAASSLPTAAFVQLRTVCVTVLLSAVCVDKLDAVASLGPAHYGKRWTECRRQQQCTQQVSPFLTWGRRLQGHHCSSTQLACAHNQVDTNGQQHQHQTSPAGREGRQGQMGHLSAVLGVDCPVQATAAACNPPQRLPRRMPVAAGCTNTAAVCCCCCRGSPCDQALCAQLVGVTGLGPEVRGVDW